MKDEFRKQLENSWKGDLEFDTWKQQREKDWKKLIDERMPELGKSITTDCGLITHLISKQVFQMRTMEGIKLQVGNYAQVSATLKALNNLPFANFLLFCETLIETNQTHVIAKYLTPEICYNEEEPAAVSEKITAALAEEQQILDDRITSTTETVIADYDWKNYIQHNLVKLTELIDPDNGLVNELLSRGVIDDVFHGVLKSFRGRVNRVAAILDHLSNFRPDCDFVKFCLALEATNQAHIVRAYLSRNCTEANDEQTAAAEGSSLTPGVARRTEVVRKLPDLDAWLNVESRRLCKDWKQTLINARSEILDCIDVSSQFIDLLVAFGVMNSATAERCLEETDIPARTEYVLDHMLRRSAGDFTVFCQALQQTNQAHIIRDYLSTASTAGNDVPDTPLSYQATS